MYMTRDKNKPTNRVLVDTDFFDYLKERVGERKTKTGAWYDLMEKASARFVTPFLKNHGYVPQDNQCHVTVSDLASDWHWHRATVRTFLEKLEEMGHIHRTRLAKSVVITVRFFQAASDGDKSAGIVQAGERMPDRLDLALTEWVFGNLSDRKVEEICGQYHERRMSDATERSDGNPSDGRPSRVDRGGEEVFGGLIGRIAMAALQRRIRGFRFDDPSPFPDLFDHGQPIDWGGVLAAVKTAAKLTLEGGHVAAESGSGNEDMPLPLRKSFKALLASYQERKGTLL